MHDRLMADADLFCRRLRWPYDAICWLFLPLRFLRTVVRVEISTVFINTPIRAMKLTCATGAVHPAAPNGGTIVSGGPFVASSIAKAGAMPTTTQTSRRSSSINEEVRPTQPNQTVPSTIPTKAKLLQSPAFLSGNKKEVHWRKSMGGEDLAKIRALTADLKKMNRKKMSLYLPAASTKPASKEKNVAGEDGSKDSSRALFPESQQPIEKEASVVVQQAKKESQMRKVSLVFYCSFFPIKILTLNSFLWPHPANLILRSCYELHCKGWCNAHHQPNISPFLFQYGSG